MGTHPIFESDFDCLTDFEFGNKLRKNGPIDEYFGLRPKLIESKRTESSCRTVVRRTRQPNNRPSHGPQTSSTISKKSFLKQSLNINMHGHFRNLWIQKNLVYRITLTWSRSRWI